MKLLTFILYLALLIAGEYYFFTEVMNKHRLLILLPSLLLVMLSIFAIVMFARKNIFSSKQAKPHS